MTADGVRTAIGIDLGGTTLKGGVVDDTGRVLLKRSQPAPAKHSPAEHIVASLVGLAHNLRREAESLGLAPEGVGLGVPNFIEGPDWIQRQVNNLPGLNDFPIRPPLVAALGEQVAIDNDVMNAGLAEYYYGGAKLFDRVFFFAIGTGIAASIFIEGGERLRYILGWPGDTGHIIVDPLGRRCTCGGRGCLETVATGPAIREQALTLAASGQSAALAARRLDVGDLDARDVTEAALAGDAGARQIWEQVGWYVGMALTTYQHIFDPHVIVIGGGVAQAGELLLDPIRRTMAELGSPYYLKHLQAVRQAALGAEAGLIGAAGLILLPEAVR
jgi:glucokinase